MWRKLYKNSSVAAPRAQLHQAVPVFPWHPDVWKQEVLQCVAEIKHYDFVVEMELWISEAKSWDKPGCKGWSRISACTRFQRRLLLLIYLILPKDLWPLPVAEPFVTTCVIWCPGWCHLLLQNAAGWTLQWALKGHITTSARTTERQKLLSWGQAGAESPDSAWEWATRAHECVLGQGLKSSCELSSHLNSHLFLAELSSCMFLQELWAAGRRRWIKSSLGAENQRGSCRVCCVPADDGCGAGNSLQATSGRAWSGCAVKAEWERDSDCPLEPHPRGKSCFRERKWAQADCEHTLWAWCWDKVSSTAMMLCSKGDRNHTNFYKGALWKYKGLQ